MDPVQKLWMFENWLEDQNDKSELAKKHAYLLASFTYPEKVKQLIGDGNTHISTEKELDESCDMVKQGWTLDALKPVPNLKHKNRRIIK
jgi:hypothetical protein